MYVYGHYHFYIPKPHHRGKQLLDFFLKLHSCIIIDGLFWSPSVELEIVSCVSSAIGTALRLPYDGSKGLGYELYSGLSYIQNWARDREVVGLRQSAAGRLAAARCHRRRRLLF